MSITAINPETQQPLPVGAPEVVTESFLQEAEANPDQAHNIAVFTSGDPEKGDEVKRAAQALHTRVYLREGFITEADTNEEGLYLDEYAAHSSYYFVVNGKKNAVARQINAEKKDGIFSLPTFKYFACDPEKVKEVAGVSSLARLKPEEVVEISALSSEKKNRSAPNDLDGAPEQDDKLQDNLQAVPFLYAQMLRDSVEKGHKLWITNMEEPLTRAITGMIGSEQLVEVGDSKEYMGPATTPVALNPQSTIESVLTSKEGYMDIYKDYIRTVFKGVNVDKVPRKFARLLRENGIETSRESLAKRAIHTKEGRTQLVAQAASLALTARIIPLMGTEEFQGSKEALIATDVATSFTYTYGALKMFTGKNAKDKLIGASLAIPSLVAPYAYYYAHGEGYPAKVNAYVGGLVLAALGNEVISRARARRKDKKMSERMRDPENPEYQKTEETSEGNLAVRALTRVKDKIRRKSTPSHTIE